METLAQPILNGILLGGLYALIAIGMSMMFGIVKLVNLAWHNIGVLTRFEQFRSVHVQKDLPDLGETQ